MKEYFIKVWSDRWKSGYDNLVWNFLNNLLCAQRSKTVLAQVFMEFTLRKDQKESLPYRHGLLALPAIQRRRCKIMIIFRHLHTFTILQPMGKYIIRINISTL